MKKYLVIQFNTTLLPSIKKVYTLEVPTNEALEKNIHEKLAKLGGGNFGIVDLNTVDHWNFMQWGNTSIQIFGAIQFFSITDTL